MTSNPAPERVSKKEWYGRGGFANRDCSRKQSKSGAWMYYYCRPDYANAYYPLNEVTTND